jgi:hypothetical protein
MYSFDMSSDRMLISKFPAANLALEEFQVFMDFFDMTLEVMFESKHCKACFTFKWFQVFMNCPGVSI